MIWNVINGILINFKVPTCFVYVFKILRTVTCSLKPILIVSFQNDYEIYFTIYHNCTEKRTGDDVTVYVKDFLVIDG